MIDSIHISANGMQSQQALVDAISNNIANVNTPAYKANHVQFGDLVSRSSESVKSEPIKGVGVNVLSTLKDFSAGELKPTGNQLDAAIVGKGFFELIDDNGDLFYSRTGSFRVDQEGFIVSVSGYPLSSLIQLPADAMSVAISGTGEVLAELPGRKEPMPIGQIDIVQFMSQDGLEAVGEGLYKTTYESGEAIYFSPEHQPSQLVQGYIESSNVDMVNELTSLVLAQKAYGLNSRILQASDEILGLINDLRR